MIERVPMEQFDWILVLFLKRTKGFVTVFEKVRGGTKISKYRVSRNIVYTFVF